MQEPEGDYCFTRCTFAIIEKLCDEMSIIIICYVVDNAIMKAPWTHRTTDPKLY